MKVLIVCVSVSHGNTRKVAEAMGAALGARVVEPEEVTAAEIGEYDLVGFGSGIFSMAFHPRLREFIKALPEGPRGRAFVFATSGFPVLMGPMTRLLGRRGFKVVDTFSVRALDTFAPLKLVGGINKGRPDAGDLNAARAFAATLS
ncbi:flavodoxin family protein [Nocardia tengchongensis]|uniref:Flavodoxin family protein n=1 Tax=Nocardia tengchongensis TaxID=2055889 RepID=A0ABX8CS51_9NOCA|nr:flavodoxin family protein [Nocardia tengchongensis]QVI21345.1 flavodoxin family protein [Nocardia tengchongensis]